MLDLWRTLGADLAGAWWRYTSCPSGDSDGGHGGRTAAATWRERRVGHVEVCWSSRSRIRVSVEPAAVGDYYVSLPTRHLPTDRTYMRAGRVVRAWG